MEWKKINEMFVIKKGKKEEALDQPCGDSCRYIQIEDLRNDDNTKYCVPTSKSVNVNPEDIIIAWDGANAGTIGAGLNGVIGSTLAKLELKSDEVDSYYVATFLKSNFKYLRERCTGATIPHISRRVLEDLSVPLPPLQTQQKIVQVLDKAQSLIDKRKEQIELMDELIQSKFYEMFGDPVVNPMGWDILRISEIGELKRGKSKHRPRNALELLGGAYPLIQTGDISNAGIFLYEYSQTYSELGLKQSKMWPKGTLCITIAANIAKTAILTFDACFPDSVVAFIPSDEANNLYIQIWLSFLQKNIETMAPESAQKNINLKILNELEVPVPPIELQNQFAEIVQKIEAQKQLMEQSLTEMENNYNSLMQRAFSAKGFN